MTNSLPDPNQPIYDRIDAALASNSRAEKIVIAMTVMIFVLGIAIIISSILFKTPLLMGAAVLVNAFLYWPIQQILKIRRQNIMLQTAPGLIATLPPDKAAKEMVKLLERLNNGK